MKKLIAFLLCLNIVLSAAACSQRDRHDDIDNGSEPIASESEPDIDEPITAKNTTK